MSHLNDQSTAIQTLLVSPGLPAIKPKVVLYGSMRGTSSSNPDGTFNFTASYNNGAVLDVSCGILNAAVVISNKIPVLPTKNGKADQGGTVRIQLDNTQKYISSFQEEAIINRALLKDMEVEVSAVFQGEEMVLYTGKIVKQPQEEWRKTTIETKGRLWDIIDTTILQEKSSSGPVQPQYEIQLDATGVKTVINNPYVHPLPPTASYRVEHYHGVTVWNEYAEIRTAVTNEGPELIELLKIDFVADINGNPPLLGKYTIEIIGVQTTSFVPPERKPIFKITQPDNQTYESNTDGSISQGFVQIDSAGWNIPTGTEREEIVGNVIEVFCYYTVSGNPISIVKNLLEKSIKGNWGENFTQDTLLPVNWLRLNELETLYAGVTIYVSETNKDNKVYSHNETAKPWRTKDLIQKILDHIECQLTYDPDGKISINTRQYLLSGESLRKYEDCNVGGPGTKRATGHKIVPTSNQYDRLVIRYGWNDFTENYSDKVVHLEGVKEKYTSIEVGFDYFKAQINQNDIASKSGNLWEIVKVADATLELSLLPNWGLPVQPGDKFEAEFTVQPVLPNTLAGLGQYWQIYSVRKRIGGPVVARAHGVPEPKIPSKFCEATFCNSTFC